MLTKLQKLWKTRGLDIFFVFCICFIILFAIYRKIKGYKGTWNKNYKFPNGIPINSINYISLGNSGKNFAAGTSRETRKAIPKESKGELECRKVMQNLFGKPFTKARPDFLRNPVTGGNFNLELDCFDPDLHIAVEYNGAQHYQYLPIFHKNKEAFLNQKYRDDMKRRICKEHNILLIEVPYTVKIEDIKGYIVKELMRNNVRF